MEDRVCEICKNKMVNCCEPNGDEYFGIYDPIYYWSCLNCNYNILCEN